MASKAIPIDLGDMADSAERIRAQGEYDSLDEVVQDGLRALERERTAFDEMVRRKVQEALDDLRPSIPLEEAFARLDKLKAERRAR